MKNKLFRDKYVDNLSSPDQFDAYIKIMNPKVWVVLVAMVIVLINTLAWTYMENQVVRILTSGVAKDGKLICYLKESDKSTFDLLKDDINVYVYDVDKTFDSFVSISEEPYEYSGDNSYAAHLSSVYYGDWIYEVTFTADVPDGAYKMIIRDSEETG